MNLIIRRISFIKEKDLSSKIEKNAVRMATGITIRVDWKVSNEQQTNNRFRRR